MTKRRTRREKLLDEINQMMGRPVGPDLDKMVAEAEAEAQQMLKDALQDQLMAQVIKRNSAVALASVMLAKAGKKFTSAGDVIRFRDGKTWQVPGA